MNIVVNGEQVQIPDGSSVTSLLEQFNLLNERIAVEKNGDIVRKADYSVTELKDGDTLEVVRFVGGG